MKDINPCNSNPCLNSATCQIVNSGLSYICSCQPGYSGTFCQICKIKYNLNLY